MRIILAIASIVVLIESSRNSPLELVLTNNKIYRGKLVDKMLSVLKAVNGLNRNLILALLYLAMTMTFIYINLTTLYINIPMYTFMAWLYFVMQFVEIILIMNFMILSNTFILRNIGIWFSKAKLLVEYLVFSLGFIFLIIR